MDGEGEYHTLRSTSSLSEGADENLTSNVDFLSAKVAIDKFFRIAPPNIRRDTVVSEGNIDSIGFTLEITIDGNDPKWRSGAIVVNLQRVAITTSGEVIGEFDHPGTYNVVVMAVDAGGQKMKARSYTLEADFDDIHPMNNKSTGPHGRTCRNSGARIDTDGEPFDGQYECDCRGEFIGDNCEILCSNGKTENGTKCKPKTNTAAIIGALVVTLVVFIAAAKYRARQESMKPLDFDKVIELLLENGTITTEQVVNDFTPRELKRSNVVLLEQIGSGAFGIVWKAMLNERSLTGRPEYQVAAKTLSSKGAQSMSAAIDDLTIEAAVMAQLAGHRNLVSIIGVVTSGDPLILVLSYCDHGSLMGHLKKRAADGKVVPATHKIDFGAQTSRGMEHLTGRHFIHRDLAARNVLLASGRSISNLVCKVADFGLTRASRCADSAGDGDNGREEYYKSQHGTFPVRWTAPEAIEELRFTSASDVWSFGILLVEIIQDGAKPFPAIKSNPGVVQFTLGGKIHPRPLECGAGALVVKLYTTACKCFTYSPGARPSFSELAEMLESFEQSDLTGSVLAHSSPVSAATGAGKTHNAECLVNAATLGFSSQGLAAASGYGSKVESRSLANAATLAYGQPIQLKHVLRKHAGSATQADDRSRVAARATRVVDFNEHQVVPKYKLNSKKLGGREHRATGKKKRQSKDSLDKNEEQLLFGVSGHESEL
jgi:serine/threonine protein kinase